MCSSQENDKNSRISSSSSQSLSIITLENQPESQSERNHSHGNSKETFSSGEVNGHDRNGHYKRAAARHSYNEACDSVKN